MNEPLDLAHTRDGAKSSLQALSAADIHDRSTSVYLRSYVNLLRRHIWLILLITFVAGVLATIYSFKMQPVYRATARIEIDPEVPLIQSLNDLFREAPDNDRTFVATQVDVLTSDSLAWRTIQQLQMGSVGTTKGPGGDKSNTVGYPTEAAGAMTRSFLGRLNVQWKTDTRIISISFEDTNPQRAARVVNTLIDNYISSNLTQRYESTQEATTWMEQRLAQLKAKVASSEQAMLDYERKNSIVNIEGTQTLAQQTLEDLSRNLTAAQTDRVNKESIYSLLSSGPAAEQFAIDDPLLQHLEGKQEDLSEQYAVAADQYGSAFPKLRHLKDQLAAIHPLIELQQKRIIEKARADYLTAKRRESALSKATAEQKEKVSRLSELEIYDSLLQRDFKTNQQLYEGLLQRLRDAEISAGLTAANIRRIDPALPPQVPIRPKTRQYIIVGLLGGLLLGFVAAFVRESWDVSIRTPDEVERLTDLPTLGIIPDFRTGLAYSYYKSSPGVKRRLPRNGAAGLIVLEDPQSSLAESYRALRSSILFSTLSKPPNLLLVTSSRPAEGKTTICVNIAVTLAQKGESVALVEADLRAPSMVKVLKTANGKGLTDVLTNQHSLDEVLLPVDRVPGLSLLPAGPSPTNPSELLSSPAMAGLLEELRQRFHYVVIDTPPVLMVTDATVLSTMVDGVLLVVESGVTTPAQISRAHQILSVAGGNIVGSVINKFDGRRDEQYYRESYYYASLRHKSG